MNMFLPCTAADAMVGGIVPIVVVMQTVAMLHALLHKRFVELTFFFDPS
jgi:hypothetical protein